MNTHTTNSPKPYAHQVKAFEMSKDRELFAFWMEMGTGKSRVIIDTLIHLWNHGRIDACMIVAPKGAYLNWKKELEIHMPWNTYTVAAWSHNAKERKFVEGFVSSPTFVSLKVLLVNVEAFSNRTPLKYIETYLKNHKVLVCVDESTRIKNHGAIRTRHLVKLGKLAKYKRVMSGSPITKNPLDLYGQCLFLDWQCLGFSSFLAFKNQYAEVVNITAGQRTFPMRVKIVGFKNQQELATRLEGFSFRCLKKDCLDLPPKVYEKYEVELTPKQMQIYKQFKQEAVVNLSETSTISAAHVLPHLLRLHQIVCGHVKTDEGKIIDIESNRISDLQEILQDTQGKVIIWAKYHQDILKICKMLEQEFGSESYVDYYGPTAQTQRPINIENFMERETCRFFVGTPSTGGLGITLTSAETVIYYSNGFDLEHRLQSEDRAHRIGQKKTVTYIDMVATGTIDEKILNALKNKQDLASLILDELRGGGAPELIL